MGQVINREVEIPLKELWMDSDDDGEPFDTDMVQSGDWCLFEYLFDSKLYYVGKVLEVTGDRVTVNFLQLAQKGKDSVHVHLLKKHRVQKMLI